MVEMVPSCRPDNARSAPPKPRNGSHANVRRRAGTFPHVRAFAVRNRKEGDMRLRMMVAASVGAAVLATSAVYAQIQNTTTLNPHELRPISSFSGIADKAERSRAIFNEVAKVVTNPRCMNCHPAGDRPLQGHDQHPHMP